LDTTNLRHHDGHVLIDPVVEEGLDSIGVGLFRLNETGHLTRFNHNAAVVLGVDENTCWDDRHISRVDRLLGSGLGENFTDIIDNDSGFVRRNLQCTNSHGCYVELDLCCLPVRDGHDSQPGVLGILYNTQGRPGSSDEPAYLRGQLRILTDVAAALSSSQELKQILKVILTGATASQGVGFNRAFLFLYDESTDQLSGHLAFGPSSAEEAAGIWRDLDALRLSLGEMLDPKQGGTEDHIDPITDLIADLSISLGNDSLLSSVCRGGTWVNLETTSEMDPVTRDFADRLGTRELALVPMVSKGKLQGLLAADNLITGQPIRDEAVRLLQILADQAAVAMERARLYDAQRERSDELERINRLLAESQDQMIKFEKMSVIGELTAAIAHELRNPLTIVGGFANLMLKSDASDEQRQYLNIISSETRRAESVLDQVLDFSRASRSDNRAIDFSRLVEQNLRLLLGRLHNQNPDMVLSLASEKLAVFGNGDQLSHAVYQFLKLVAEDLIPPGSAEVRTESRNGRAVLWIKINCPEEARGRITGLLQRILKDNRASQRLTILVAGETIRYHSGDFGLAIGDDSIPSLFVELPLAKESGNESTSTGSG